MDTDLVGDEFGAEPVRDDKEHGEAMVRAAAAVASAGSSKLLGQS